MQLKTSVYDNYECDGQMSIQDFLPVEYGEISCRVCHWHEYGSGECHWMDKHHQASINPDNPRGCEKFQPSEYLIPGMCASCKYSKSFKYDIKPEYQDKLINGYSRESADDPVENENIYCDHEEGSLNRRCAYKDYQWEGFGVGHWNRQHEYDTCDRYEPDKLILKE